jgi:hypothetical protein
LKALEENNSPTLLVFTPVYGVTSTGTYPDMHRRMRLVDEHKSGAIWWIYFLPATLSNAGWLQRSYFIRAADVLISNA